MIMIKKFTLLNFKKILAGTKISLLIVALAFALVGSNSVYAADITYSVDTTVALSSPVINLTILAGSVATTTVVNAGTVVVTVPVSSVFTITSADRQLNFSGETGFGIITTSCTSPTLSKVTITTTSGSAQTITISPGAVACSINSGGGGTPTPTPVVTPISTPVVTPISTPVVTPINTPTTPATPASVQKTFNFGVTTLKSGSKGEPVKELQKFLNQVLKLGLAVDGKLGPKTIAVIKKWQKANGLKADGLIGPKTKAKMNSMAK